MRQAEVAAFFKKFDEAEEMYVQMDRVDLAVELRMRMGEWFKVEKLVEAGHGEGGRAEACGVLTDTFCLFFG